MAVLQEPLIAMDFSGGLNLRDAPIELEDNESPACANVTFTERGGVQKALGFLKDGAMAAFAADLANGFDSEVLGQLVVQEGVNVRKRTAAGSFSLVKAFTTAERVTFVDFKRKLLMLHPTDGLFSYDGVTVAGPLGPAGPVIKGKAIAVWQNKVWVMEASAANPTTVWRSAIGNEASWATATDFTNLRDLDDKPGTCLAVSRNGLLAAKRDSVYRFTSAETGFVQIIDPNRGAGGALAAVPYEGRIAFVNEHGIFFTDGLSELVEASQKISTLFGRALNLTALDKLCAGAHQDSLVFSIRQVSQLENDLVLEYHPLIGWWTLHTFGASFFVTHTKEDDQLYHGAPGSTRFLHKTFSGGSHDGAAIASHWQTKWFAPNGSYRTRLHRGHLSGRGEVDVYVKRDYELSDGLLFPTLFQSPGGTVAKMNAGDLYDSGKVWGPDAYEHQADLWRPGVCNQVAFLIRETSTLTTQVGPLPGGGPLVDVGAWAFYGFRLDHSLLSPNA